MLDLIRMNLQQAQSALEQLIINEKSLKSIEAAARLLLDAFAGGGRAFSCGNGGSMCDAMHRVENGHGIVSEPYHEGRAGLFLRIAKACTVSGAALTLLTGRKRVGAVLSGGLLAAGSLLTRFGVFEAGLHSAKDPKYTVIPQRERLAARQNGHAPTVTR